MTLLDDIGEVHDGVLKSPSLGAYDIPHTTHPVNIKAGATNKDIYYEARYIAVQMVRIMGLATKNIEKEQTEKFKRELVEHFNQNVQKDKYEECKTCHKYETCKVFPKDKHCMEYDSTRKTIAPNDEPDYAFEVGLVLVDDDGATKASGYCEQIETMMRAFAEHNDLKMPPAVMRDNQRR